MSWDFTWFSKRHVGISSLKESLLGYGKTLVFYNYIIPIIMYYAACQPIPSHSKSEMLEILPHGYPFPLFLCQDQIPLLALEHQIFLIFFIYKEGGRVVNEQQSVGWRGSVDSLHTPSMYGLWSKGAWQVLQIMPIQMKERGQKTNLSGEDEMAMSPHYFIFP